MTSDEVLDELNKQGLRPATVEELLALGAQQPDLQRQYPVVALGSVCVGSDGDRLVPELWGYGCYRFADLYWLHDDWFSYYRFAAVSK